MDKHESPQRDAGFTESFSAAAVASDAGAATTRPDSSAAAALAA